MRKGLFISVDGPNGAGKTTFIRTLVENLSVNYDVYDTREPSPTSFGTFVKKNEGGLKGMQYAQLIWADRHYHLQTCVQPQLSLGKIVVCDRYIALYCKGLMAFRKSKYGNLINRFYGRTLILYYLQILKFYRKDCRREKVFRRLKKE